MPPGGARPNSGPKKGTKYRKTLEKEAAREFVRQRITAELGPIIDAQIALAKGVRFLVTRDKATGKFIRVTEQMARRKQASGEEDIEIWEKLPSTESAKSLLDRAIDKPKEQALDINLRTKLEDLVTASNALKDK